ncbi:MAG: EamA family transporter [Clostridiales bacterium]|nr:EamA family transporter [Clostridiales bacterium]MDY4143307.1 EamA family transporter [Oscillospiraceae bacterium]
MKLILSVLVMTLFGSLGALFLKRGSAKVSELKSLVTTPQIWLGGLFYLAGALLNIYLLRGYSYSIVYPLTSLTYVWSLILSALLLHEKVTVQKLFGIAAICLGAFLLVQ